MAKVTSELSELKMQNVRLQSVKSEVETSMELVNVKYEDVKSKLVKLESERCEQINHIGKLEKRIQDLQRLHRPSIIELRNVPTKENESSIDLISMLVSACNSLQLKLEPTEIRDIHRSKNRQGPSKQIIVELHSVAK